MRKTICGKKLRCAMEAAHRYDVPFLIIFLIVIIISPTIKNTLSIEMGQGIRWLY